MSSVRARLCLSSLSLNCVANSDGATWVTMAILVASSSMASPVISQRFLISSSHLSNAGSKSLTSVVVVGLNAPNVAPVSLISVDGSNLFLNFRYASKPLHLFPLRTDRGSPTVCVWNVVRVQGFVARCLHDVRACYGCGVNNIISSSFCPCQRCRDACLSETSPGVVAPLVMPVTSELLDLDFYSCEELLLLRLLWLLLCCKPLLYVSYPLRELVHLRC